MKKEKIYYDRIRSGSRVMIKDGFGQSCGEIDTTRPVDVIFYKTEHYIDSDGKFQSTGRPSIWKIPRCTFHQDGKFVVLYANYDKPDFIVNVIKY
jgi:hypothetical protein